MSSLSIFVKTFFSLVITWSLFGLPATLLTTPASANLPRPRVTNHEMQYAPPAAYEALPLTFELNR